MVARFWSIWTARNDRAFNDIAWNIVALRELVDSHVATWQEAFASASSLGGCHLSESWSPPPIGTVKCNVDAALHHGYVSFGAVLRNHEGGFVAACNGHIACPRDPYLAESMAVKEALTWLKSCSFFNVIIEYDCLNFCTAFNSLGEDFSYVGHLIRQCRLLATEVGNVLVCHVRRSANHVAHVLARATGSSPFFSVWDFIPPDVFRI
ncbi:uncharacterized protein LOC116010781 [Ipomoea triloba]|uniref:uncharacterized protein LOC116010781 n=1 Tax=Ipomoea triloba TaxID=35885 RepID=UPI00125D3149|nr:uncharacterized protein LOC116010781 [Ipomoea triloba]